MTFLKRWTRVLAGAGSSVLSSGIAFAQQESTTKAVTTTSGTTQVWYGQWWIWAVGVAIFLIVIIALTNRGSSTKA